MNVPMRASTSWIRPMAILPALLVLSVGPVAGQNPNSKEDPKEKTGAVMPMFRPPNVSGVNANRGPDTRLQIPIARISLSERQPIARDGPAGPLPAPLASRELARLLGESGIDVSLDVLNRAAASRQSISAAGGIRAPVGELRAVPQVLSLSPREPYTPWGLIGFNDPMYVDPLHNAALMYVFDTEPRPITRLRSSSSLTISRYPVEARRRYLFEVAVSGLNEPMQFRVNELDMQFEVEREGRFLFVVEPEHSGHLSLGIQAQTVRRPADREVWGSWRFRGVTITRLDP